MEWKPDQLLNLGLEVTEACLSTVSSATDWSATGQLKGQHVGDVVADEAGLRLLVDAGVNVFSEESGLLDQDSPITAVLDPIDGSTNAARGLPYWTSAICLLLNGSPVAGIVRLSGSQGVFAAINGGGATFNGHRVAPSSTESLRQSVIFVNGYPRQHLGWAQMRSLGSAALEISLLARGSGDGFIDCSDGLAVWDYLAAALILTEAGGVVHIQGAELMSPSLDRERHKVVAAGNPTVLAALRGQPDDHV
ncbi:inositol monophosphatase [Ferrimicrobium sp.]|uniref:inositol monophosphatase family protein n=1 Tax=Ferrimicrobium sp. TaxID=2926050 RepID=UPI002614ABEC|nr:inositol monophosphatase [Ferrimicrobium sp.]